MAQRSYVVKSGDSLWRISELELGAGKQWPRLWRYNNRAAVVKVTGRGIPDPDLIYPGQTLLIPDLSGGPSRPGVAHPVAPNAQATPPKPTNQTAASKPSGSATPAAGKPTASPGGGPLSGHLTAIQSPISFKYRLDDLRFPPMIQPGVIMEIRMTGDVLLMTKKAYPATYVTSRGEIEGQVTSQANLAFNSLISDTRMIFDPANKSLTYRSMLVTQGNGANAPATAVGVELSSNSPIPKLRFEYRFPKLEGSVHAFNYVAMDVKIVVELTPTVQPPSAQPIQQGQPVVAWDKVLGVGLLVAAGAVVVATIVEDFGTLGGGIADDPPSFAAASMAAARGLQLLRTAAVVLPTAAAPAMVTLSISLKPVTSPAGHVQ